MNGLHYPRSPKFEASISPVVPSPNELTRLGSPDSRLVRDMHENGLPTPVEGRAGEALRGDLQRVVESLIELGVVVHDYPGDEPRSSELLQRKLGEFLADARSVASSADDVAGIDVPLDILTYIDNGRNPDIYSREFVELITRLNQSIAGELDALAQFKNQLAVDIAEQFPELEPHVAAFR